LNTLEGPGKKDLDPKRPYQVKNPERSSQILTRILKIFEDVGKNWRSSDIFMNKYP